MMNMSSPEHLAWLIDNKPQGIALQYALLSSKVS